MPIRIAVVDSGVIAHHPHLDGVSVEARALASAEGSPTLVAFNGDRTGHGTAVTAAILRALPSGCRATFLSIAVLDEELRTTRGALAAAIRLAADAGCAFINLSLGSTAPEAELELAEAVSYAEERQAICICAAHPRGGTLWPADLRTVLSATTHRSALLKDLYRVAGERPRYLCHGWPRAIEGAPPESNLFGTSFAAAHLCARAVAQSLVQPRPGFADLVVRLDAEAAPWTAVA